MSKIRSVLFGLLFLVFVLLLDDAPRSEPQINQVIESAIWPWGDKDYLLFNDSLTVSVDLGDDVDFSRLDMLVEKVFIEAPSIDKIIAAGYIEEDGKKRYYPEKRLIVTRSEFEAHERAKKDKKVN